MEKPVRTRNEKVSNYISNDLAFSILSKLPLKSLKRFGCVHKSWALLFENPSFMNMLCNNFLSNNHSYNEDTYLLLNFHINNMFYDKDCVLHSLSGGGFENRIKLNWPNPFQDDYNHGFNILGSSSINGIICLTTCSDPRIVLWNPTTEEFKVIPPSPSDLVQCVDVDVDRHGFGYDCVRNDYKVIQRVTFDIKWVSLEDMSFYLYWEIYSLQNNSWRKLEANIPYYDNKGMYMDGVYHWWSEGETTDSESYLVSFDFSNEVFLTTPMLSTKDDNFCLGFVLRDLAVLSGSIALISNYIETDTLQISILGELGVKESWIKLFTVRPLPYIEHPIGVGNNGDIFFERKNGKLAYFDLINQRIEELGVIGEGSCHEVATYKESLLLIGEKDN